MRLSRTVRLVLIAAALAALGVLLPMWAGAVHAQGPDSAAVCVTRWPGAAACDTLRARVDTLPPLPPDTVTLPAPPPVTDTLYCTAGVCSPTPPTPVPPPDTTTPAPLPTTFAAVHSSRRYFQDAAGKPVFLLGYYTWASVDPNTTGSWPTHYADMMTRGAAYKLNYIRISLGLNTSSGGNPVPFTYVGDKADLDQANPVFWSGLKHHLDLAREKGFFAHVALYDGVSIRSGPESFRYNNSWWNPVNQTRTFHESVDVDADGTIDEAGEFYRAADFTAATGIGTYQRRVAERALQEIAPYPNVLLELGNELFGSPAAWNRAVYDFAKARTPHVVTQNGGGISSLIDGVTFHNSATSLALKAALPAIVGKGYPAWEDPDGPALKGPGQADENRRAAWYALTGGAAGWGGFSTTLNHPEQVHEGWDTTQTNYYKHLVTFIEESRARFWEMTPQHGLVSGGSVENSVLAKANSQYLVYVRDDASVTVNLSSLTKTAWLRRYVPATGKWFGSVFSWPGGGSPSFTRPTSATDWVVYITTDSTVFASAPTPAPAPATDSVVALRLWPDTLTLAAGASQQFCAFAEMSSGGWRGTTDTLGAPQPVMCDSVGKSLFGIQYGAHLPAVLLKLARRASR